MTINFHDPVNHNGLFDEQGHCFYAEDVLNASLQTTVPTAIQEIVTGWKLLGADPKFSAMLAPISSALTTWQNETAVFTSIAGAAASLLQSMVMTDLGLTTIGQTAALQELIFQMQTNAQTVKGCTVNSSVLVTAGNAGDGMFVTSVKRGDGLMQENSLNESLAVAVTGAGVKASYTVTGAPALAGAKSGWPAGSAANVSSTTIDPANSLVPNGNFESNLAIPNLPDGWTPTVGTVGTTLFLTTVCVQQIVVSGTPTAGNWIITIVDRTGVTRSTGPIVFNATAAQVQSAIRLLPNFGGVVVTSTGTSPNFTYKITFSGYGGAVAQVTVQNYTTAGVFTVSTPTPGTGLVFQGGFALQIKGTSAELTAINVPLPAAPVLTPLAVSSWLACDVTPVQGVLFIELTNGLGGAVIADAQGVPNSFSLSLTTLGSTFKHLSQLVTGETVFRLPGNFSGTPYLRLRLNPALSSTTNLFVDNMAITPMTQLYKGGPFVSGFGGSKPFAAGDGFTVNIANNRAGKIQEHYGRNFPMAAQELLLPSVTNGSETIPDSLIN